MTRLLLGKASSSLFIMLFLVPCQAEVPAPAENPHPQEKIVLRVGDVNIRETPTARGTSQEVRVYATVESVFETSTGLKPGELIQIVYKNSIGNGSSTLPDPGFVPPLSPGQRYTARLEWRDVLGAYAPAQVKGGFAE